MAEKPLTVSEVENESKKKRNITCTICLDPCKDPKALPCCHTFCKGCLERTFQQQNKHKPSSSPAKHSPLKTFEGKKVAFEALSLGSTAPVLTLEPRPIEKLTSIVALSRLASPSVGLESVSLPVDAVKQKPPVICCPVCKAKHEIPEGGIDSFPTDYYTLQISESESVMKSLSSKSQAECGSCSDDDKELEGYCNDCGMICTDCVRAHKKMALYKSHTVIPLKEYTPDKHVPKRRQKQCGAHNKEVVLYCNTCSKLICPVCIVERHKPHEIITLDEADRTLCMQVKQTSEVARQNLTTFQSYSEYINGVERELGNGEYTKELRARINERFEEHIRELQARREELITKVEDSEVFAKKNLWAQKAHVDMIITKIESGLMFTDRALRCTNPTERITMNKQGSDLLRQVAEAKWNHESIPPPLVYRCGEEDVDILLSFGEVSPICSKDVEIELEEERDFIRNTKAQLGKPAQIKVKFTVPLVKAAAPFFQILYGKRKQILDTNEVVAYENNEESNTWNIEFVPRCSGTHSIQVWVGGIQVTNKEISVTGSLRVGSNVQPGPDWKDTSTVVMLGRVVQCHTNQVSVDWREVGGRGDICIAAEGVDVLADDDTTVPEKPHTESDDDLVETVEQAIELDANVSRYKWGEDEEYEVELVL